MERGGEGRGEEDRGNKREKDGEGGRGGERKTEGIREGRGRQRE